VTSTKQAASLSLVKQQLLAALGSAPQQSTERMSVVVEDARVREWQEALAAIWAEVLEKPAVTASDNYFRLGGNSVLSILITAKARAVGIPLTTPLLLANPTLRGLVHAVIAAESAVSPLAAHAQPDAQNEYPLTPMQAGILHDCLFAPEQHLYESHLVLELSGEIESALLSLAWNQTFRANLVLANRFTTDAAGVPVQGADRTVRCDLVHIDCSASPERVASVLEEQKAQFAERCRRPDRAPLCGLALLTVASGRHLLLFTHHHLLLDGWSQQLVLQELFSTYAAFRDGLEAPRITREPFVRHVAYARAKPIDARWWQAALADLDRNRQLTVGSNDRWSTTRTVPIAPQVWCAIGALSADAGITVAVLIQGIWALVLAATAQSRDVVYGLTVSGRDTLSGDGIDFSSVVGMCINTLPVRVKLGADVSLTMWLQSLQRNIWDVLARQHNALAEILRVTRSRAADPPLFESLLVIENIPTPPQRDEALPVRVQGFEIREGLPIVLVAFLNEEPRIELRLQPACCKAGVPERLQETLSRALQMIPSLSLSTRIVDVLDSLARGPKSSVNSALRTSRRMPA
jgi:nonribosomal peptide synthetase protein BlmV